MPDVSIRPTPLRRLLTSTLAWGALLLALAIAVAWITNDLGIVVFLLLLAGGWCFGSAFVNLTFRVNPVRLGAVLHTVVAVASGAVMALVVAMDAEIPEALPEPVRAALVVLALAAIPAVGWIWVALIGRVTAVARGTTAPPPEPSVWHPVPDGSAVDFRAVPMTMRTLTVSILAIVFVIGALGALALIALDGVIGPLGPRLVVVIVGVLFALPAYGVFALIVRARARDCRVVFADRELRLIEAGDEIGIRYDEIELLRWRQDSDYARLEIATPEFTRTLIVGLAKPADGFSAGLPPLPRRVMRLLDEAGLVAKRSRKGALITYRRAVGSRHAWADAG